MNATMDTILAAIGLPITLAIPTVVAVAAYRQTHPYKVVGYSLELGMVAVRWRDQPDDQTHWLTPAHLQQQIGTHR